ncbi:MULTISPECIES: YbaY family lipoprotein [Vibrio]|uniref:Lipo-like protein n=1 Tax=Vibrio algicola TaxID=2662262 RepID=A0A5Q0TDE5_9VIBR|nr:MULTISPECIES: YbaY family lipoprotein [Vibrio]MBD1577495.1 lipo-like protein [Vibrio sp. S11_S32]
MKKSVMLVSSIICASWLAGCSSSPTIDTQETPAQAAQVGKPIMLESIVGTVAYRERLSLPETAVLTVTLEDVSIADKKADIIATESMITGGKQVPFNFKLDFDNNKILQNHTYVVRAKIALNGKLRFTTDTAYRVITDSNQTQSVQLMLVGVK